MAFTVYSMQNNYRHIQGIIAFYVLCAAHVFVASRHKQTNKAEQDFTRLFKAHDQNYKCDCFLGSKLRKLYIGIQYDFIYFALVATRLHLLFVLICMNHH